MIKNFINLVSLSVLIAIFSLSCKSSSNRINSNTDSVIISQNNQIETNVISNQDTNGVHSSLRKIEFDNIPQELKNFPLSWERFGIEKGDTVTYKFCNASNPEFTINNDYRDIHIIVGNELNQTLKISSIYYNDSIFKIILEPNNTGLNECVFKWIDKIKMIGTLLIYADKGSFEYLPKSKLIDKSVIEEKCD